MFLSYSFLFFFGVFHRRPSVERVVDGDVLISSPFFIFAVFCLIFLCRLLAWCCGKVSAMEFSRSVLGKPRAAVIGRYSGVSATICGGKHSRLL